MSRLSNVLVLLVLAAVLGSAQVKIMPSFRPNAPIVIDITPSTNSATAITGLPYSGDRLSERTLSDGTHMSQSMVRQFRDSLGRIREEHSGQGFGPLTIIEIFDPVAGLDWVLDPANERAYRMVLQSKSCAASHDLLPCEPAGEPSSKTMPDGNAWTSQQLGSQRLQGIEACGRRTTIKRKDGTLGLTAENWFSREDIGGVMLTRSSDEQTGQSISELVNVRFSEPDPGLFVAPTNFRVIDETAAFTITGPAPVTQSSPPATKSRTTVSLTGMPWSGDLTTEGRLLFHEVRDSMGRTRRGATTVTIVDPVAGYSYTLDTAAQTAHRKSIAAKFRPATEATAPPATGTQSRILSSGVIALTESLGSKTIDGVAAFGTRVTLTYPPGTMSGNDKTTSTVNESWFSPQLGTSLLMHSSGALVPNSTSTLTNLTYSEPDPSLFQVPDGYRIIDDK
jgi:hypothetical protein